MEQSRSIEELTEQIRKDISDNHVIIYAKGEKNMAQCGFSHRVMEIFNALDVPYAVRNIFSDPNIRPAVCAFTSWPTTPQVFVDGKFVGGCDIVTEMYQNGELQKLVQETAKPQ